MPLNGRRFNLGKPFSKSLNGGGKKREFLSRATQGNFKEKSPPKGVPRPPGLYLPVPQK